MLRFHRDSAVPLQVLPVLHPETLWEVGIDVAHRHVVQLVHGVAQGTAGGFVDVEDLAVCRHPERRISNGVHRELGQPQRTLPPFALGDVQGKSDAPYYAAPAIPQRLHEDFVDVAPPLEVVRHGLAGESTPVRRDNPNPLRPAPPEEVNRNS
jgi:hypothetical protein